MKLDAVQENFKRKNEVYFQNLKTSFGKDEFEIQNN